MNAVYRLRCNGCAWYQTVQSRADELALREQLGALGEGWLLNPIAPPRALRVSLPVMLAALHRYRVMIAGVSPLDHTVGLHIGRTLDPPREGPTARHVL